MTRAELIRMFVVDSMCDDYEDIQQITKWTVEWGSKCGLTISHEDIIRALRELIEMGYAKAWDLTQPKREPPKEYQGMPTRDQIRGMDPHFISQTEEGVKSFEQLPTEWLLDERKRIPEVWLELLAAMNREELIHWFVRESIRRRYMTMAHLEKRRDALADRCGISISQDEIMQVLRESIERGYAKAYDLDRTVSPPKQYEGMPPLEDIKPWDGAYFYVTQEGLEFHETVRPLWPFEEDADGEFKLREDWTLPGA
jgi:hypothetical protein